MQRLCFNQMMRIALSLAGLNLAAGCSGIGSPFAQRHTGDHSGDQPAQLFRGMGDYTWDVTTASDRARAYFDQGLIWMYAFNHDEAIRSFTEAGRLDPDFAMAWWGVALCNGPHINNPIMPEQRSHAAWDALQKAIALKPQASAKEQALIDALAGRYADPQRVKLATLDRAPLDQAYADAMAKVWEQYPADPNVGTLYAEALMDLHPWDLYMQDRSPKPWTGKVVTLLEKVMAMAPNNPGANHLYIHAVEASQHPEKAKAAADRLRDMVPASGHLVHMPSHIDVLTGRWNEAADQNIEAMKIDRWYRKKSPKQEFYRLYMFHNSHMLSFAGMMSGRFEEARRAAQDVVDGLPEEYKIANAAFVDPYMCAEYDVLKRFGKWDMILAEPAPPAYLPITTTMWRYSRGIAYAAKGDIAHAEAERAAFLAARERVPDGAMFAINPAETILKIAEHMLDGEIELARENYDGAVAALEQGIAIEDSLVYMEPPEWIQPVRHTLGAVLLKADRPADAEKVYRKDLERWPANGWSLYGLSRCLSAQGQTAKAAKYETQFDDIWRHGDTPIGSSCLCVPKT